MKSPWTKFEGILEAENMRGTLRRKNAAQDLFVGSMSGARDPRLQECRAPLLRSAKTSPRSATHFSRSVVRCKNCQNFEIWLENLVHHLKSVKGGSILAWGLWKRNFHSSYPFENMKTPTVTLSIDLERVYPLKWCWQQVFMLLNHRCMYQPFDNKQTYFEKVETIFTHAYRFEKVISANIVPLVII